MPVATPTIDKNKYARTFERGSRGAIGPAGPVVSNGASRPRLPQALADELKDKAWERRTNFNALVVEILQQWLDNQGGKGR